MGASLQLSGAPAAAPRLIRRRDLALLIFLFVALAIGCVTVAGNRRAPYFALPAFIWGITMYARLAMGRAASVGWSVGAALLVGVVNHAWAGAVCGAAALASSELIAPASRRLDVLRTGLWTGLSGATLALLPAAVPGALRSFSLADASLLLSAGPLAAAGVVAFGAPLERLFGHVTRLTIAEWLSYDHPLLRLLSLRAPGTLQHSIHVGMLADAAARAIGADALHARVGSLYHDVGKLHAPEYFSENQHGANPHDAIAPEESARILRAHVHEGVALLKAHGMGERLADFVREHHGTSLMRSFLHRARARGAEGKALEVFRYDGPAPRSRETGLVMIADQTEAISRSAAPQDTEAADAILRAVIARLMSEGQLDHAGFGREDLDRAREAMRRVLLAMHHRRVSYPPDATAPPRRWLVPRFARGRSLA